MKKGYYKADTINGVYFYDSLIDDSETDIISARDFLGSLKYLEDGEEISCFIDVEDMEIFDEIEDQYGINNDVRV